MFEKDATVNFLKKLPKSSGEATNQPSSVGTPMTAESALQTPTTNAKQTGVSFNADRSGEATNQPSLFGTPMTAKSALQTPTTNSTQKSVSFNADRSGEAANKSSSFGTPMTVEYDLNTCVDRSDEAIDQPSFFGTPVTAKSALQTPATSATQTGVSFHPDRSGEAANKSSLFGTPMAIESVLNTCVSFNDGHSVEAINTPFGTPMTAKSALQTPTTNSTQKSVSFNVDDSDEANKPSFFGTPITAKSALKSPTTSGTTSNNDEEVVIHAHDQMLQMQQELESAKAEAENYKKAAHDLQFVLDEEKRRSKSRIADLQKQNFALSDEVGTLKRRVGIGGGKRQKLGDDKDDSAANTIKSLREQLEQMGEQYAKAFSEIVAYRTKVKMLQKEIDDMEVALNAEKNARLVEVEKLKNDCDYHRNINTSIQNVNAAAEAEAKHYKMKAKNAQQQVDELEAALAVEKKSIYDRIAEVRYEKDTEIDSLQDKISQIKGQLEKANAEKEKLNEKVAQLYDYLDGAANDQKAYCETIFDLQSKLVNFVKDDDQVRVPIDTTPAAPLSTIMEEESI